MCEERVVPVFVQHPKPNTEDLEDEEWSNGMLPKQLREGWNGNIECIFAIVLMDSRDFRCACYTPGYLKVSKYRLRLGVDCIG